MESVYKRIRQIARQIVARFPPPVFYSEQAAICKHAEEAFRRDPIIKDLQDFVAAQMDDNLGHGLGHATKVAHDAGALMIIEGPRAGYSESLLNRQVCVVQCAALLHDIRRKVRNHSKIGAEYARQVLKAFPLSDDERLDICTAIRNHEAFTNGVAIDTPHGGILSDCLYDADKFRWGPDNFTDTIWKMVAQSNPPLSKFVSGYPRGMRRLAGIRATFRSTTGQKYGPQFIDLGIDIGNELLAAIESEFSHLL